MEAMIAALPDFVVGLLGVAIAAVSGAVTGYSVSTIQRRRQAEQHFHAMLVQRLAEEPYLLKDFEALLPDLERRQGLPHYDRYLLDEVLYKTLAELEPKEQRLISNALNQPSPTGRSNYVRKVMTDTIQTLHAADHGSRA